MNFFARTFTVLTAIIFHLAAFTALADIEIRGEIFNAMTSKTLPGVKVEILRSDSSLIDSTTANLHSYFYDNQSNQLREEHRGVFSIKIPKTEGNYIVRTSMDGYRTLCTPLPLTKIGRRQSEYLMPNIYMRTEQVATDLGEVVVKASKVKFYNKGDTIVYNADAFMLPEGSMLDALVQQLPGVEIRDGGAIYVNGRYVESLLLNGKDFFKGNQETMLQNLGAYLVKDIQVYEKGGHLSEMMGKKLIDDTQYVMDVKLKKDYMAGNLINATATGGTADRYLGKLFAMHYTNNSRIAAYGNVNNLNDSEKPNDGRGRRGYNRPKDGLTDTYRSGIDYFADNPTHTWEANGNVDVTYDKNTDYRDSYVTNFLSGGDTYDFSFSRPVAKNLAVATNHKLRLKREKWELDITPSFNYSRGRSESTSTAASFSKEADDVTPDIITSIFNGSQESLRQSLINRNINRNSGLQHGFKANLFSEFFYKFKQSNDLSSIWVSGTYNDYRANRDNTQDIAYGPAPSSQTMLEKIFKEIPDRSHKINAGMKYYFNIPNGTTGFLYNFIHSREKKQSELFMIEARQQTRHELPYARRFYSGDMETPYEDPVPVYDPDNSYTSTLTQNYHQIRPFYTQEYKGDFGSLNFKLSPEFSFHHRHLDYLRGPIDVSPSKNNFTIRIMDTMVFWRSADNSWNAYLGYDRTPTLASLVDMVDIKDTTDPLNIQEGNPDLKNSTSNDISFNASYYKDNSGHNIYFRYRWTENDMVRGYRYDSSSGVRTFKTYNVSGNSSLSAYYSIYQDLNFGPVKLTIDNWTQYNLSRYADMVGYDMEPQKQKVTNNMLNEELYLMVGISNFRAQLGGGVNWRHTSSEAVNFEPFNAFDFGYGANLSYNNQKGFHISTELRMQSRRGYSQSEMNDNCLLWNAEASYSILKGSLMFKVNAYDILRQVKNIRYSVDALARTETRMQTLPRYVALTVQYNFDFRPKREKNQQ